MFPKIEIDLSVYFDQKPRLSFLAERLNDLCDPRNGKDVLRLFFTVKSILELLSAIRQNEIYKQLSYEPCNDDPKTDPIFTQSEFYKKIDSDYRSFFEYHQEIEKSIYILIEEGFAALGEDFERDSNQALPKFLKVERPKLDLQDPVFKIIPDYDV